jgi:hypothetical protein
MPTSVIVLEQLGEVLDYGIVVAVGRAAILPLATHR